MRTHSQAAEIGKIHNGGGSFPKLPSLGSGLSGSGFSRGASPQSELEARSDDSATPHGKPAHPHHPKPAQKNAFTQDVEIDSGSDDLRKSPDLPVSGPGPRGSVFSRGASPQSEPVKRDLSQVINMDSVDHIPEFDFGSGDSGTLGLKNEDSASPHHCAKLVLKDNHRRLAVPQSLPTITTIGLMGGAFLLGGWLLYRLMRSFQKPKPVTVTDA